MRYFSLAAAMVVTALPYSFNYAQVDDVTQSEMNEVVVTASLQPIELQQSANAITVISAQDIENSHATMVSDLLRDVPGVAVNRNGVLGSSTQLRMRGAEGNHVLVMIDGVEVNDAAQGDEFNWAHLPVTGIERIEIVRGPQSALWGSDAVAGVVNILTRKASQPLEGNAYSEVGNHGTNHSGFSLGAGGQAYHVNISGSHVSADGENISRHGGEEDGYRNTTVNLNAGWQPLDNLSFSLSGRQTEGENEFDATDFFVTGLPQDSDNETEFRQRFGRLQSDLSLFDDHWQQRLAVSVSRHNNDEFTDGSLTGNTFSRKRQYSYLSALNWAENTQQLSFLAEHETEDFSQRGTAQPWGDPNQDRKRRTDSLALEYRITLWDDLTLAASVRHDDNSEFDNANTRRFEASYTLPNGDTRLRANYGTAVKSPTFTERFGYFTNFQGNPDLQPEESKSWEVGIDQTLLEGDLLLGLTYFRSRLEKEIYFIGNTAENVDGTSERQGVEATLDAKLSATLGLKASYTYTDATQPASGLDRDIDETRRPRHLGSVSLNWSPTNQVNINLNAQYNGSQDDVFYPPWPQPSRVVKLDDYTLLNLSASYQMNKQLSFYTRLDNILDDDYEEVYGYQTLGFGAVFGVRYNFAP